MEQRKNLGDYIFIVLAIVFSFSAFMLLHEFFGRDINNFTIEILAAVLGSVIIVASMAIMLRLQAKQDKEREFSSTLFERKLQIYEKLLATIFEADDDNRISKSEVQNVENQIGVACLVANEDLVSIFAQFTYQFKIYGVLYFRSMTTDQREHFIQFIEHEITKDKFDSRLAFGKQYLRVDPQTNPEAYFLSLDELIQGVRSDLAVVEGDIRRSVEHFVRFGYDQFRIMKTPNIVDESQEGVSLE